MPRGLFDHEVEQENSNRPLTVSALTQQIKSVLEQRVGTVWVTGEVSNLSRPRSGHLYFNLKDDNAVLPVAMWRSSVARLQFEIENGQELVCQGGLDVYAPHGAYKLIARKAEPLGLGPLQLAFQQLFEKLSKEGLFNPELKKPLPRFPQRIGIVTSPTGAAVRDFIQTAKRRWPLTSILVIPAKVQGAGAAQEIADGLELANLLRPKLDLIVTGRGGGSLEDLWCFNEEQTIRAIAASTIPVISAVGHEVDVTLADLVADHRALTPTAAAELALPSKEEFTGQLTNQSQRLRQALFGHVSRARMKLESLSRRPVFVRPMETLRNREQRLDELERRAELAISNQLHKQDQKLSELAAKLNSISPLQVLSRGYSIIQNAETKSVINSIKSLAPGEKIECRFEDGAAIAEVNQVLD